MAASTVGQSYTHTSAQCSPANVGLTQARPNYLTRAKKGAKDAKYNKIMQIASTN